MWGFKLPSTPNKGIPVAPVDSSPKHTKQHLFNSACACTWKVGSRRHRRLWHHISNQTQVELQTQSESDSSVVKILWPYQRKDLVWLIVGHDMRKSCKRNFLSRLHFWATAWIVIVSWLNLNLRLMCLIILIVFAHVCTFSLATSHCEAGGTMRTTRLRNNLKSPKTLGLLSKPRDRIGSEQPVRCGPKFSEMICLCVAFDYTMSTRCCRCCWWWLSWRWWRWRWCPCQNVCAAGDVPLSKDLQIKGHRQRLQVYLLLGRWQQVKRSKTRTCEGGRGIHWVH